MEIKIVKSENLNIKEAEIREPLMDDVVLAERIAGKTDGVEFQLALLSQVGTFDGQKLPMEELRKLSMKDFFSIAQGLLGTDMQALLKELLGSSSTLPAKEDSATQKSAE